MVDFAKLSKRRRLMEEFGATELGAVYLKYDGARDAAAAADARLEYTDKGYRKARETQDAMLEARQEFIRLLLPLVGIEDEEGVI